MKYHVVPDLTPEEIATVKVVAIRLGISVKEFVKQAVLYYLTLPQIKSVLKKDK